MDRGSVSLSAGGASPARTAFELQCCCAHGLGSELLLLSVTCTGKVNRVRMRRVGGNGNVALDGLIQPARPDPKWQESLCLCRQLSMQNVSTVESFRSRLIRYPDSGGGVPGA